MAEGPNNDGYAYIFGDYVIHKESDTGLLIVGYPGVGKTFLVSKLIDVRDDLTQDPNSAWNLGGEGVYVRSENGTHYIKGEGSRDFRYKGINYSESNRSDMIYPKVEKVGDWDRERILKGVLNLKRADKDNNADLGDLISITITKVDVRALIKQWEKNKMLREVSYWPDEREAALEKIVVEETERFASFFAN